MRGKVGRLPYNLSLSPMSYLLFLLSRYFLSLPVDVGDHIDVIPVVEGIIFAPVFIV